MLREKKSYELPLENIYCIFAMRKTKPQNSINSQGFAILQNRKSNQISRVLRL